MKENLFVVLGLERKSLVSLVVTSTDTCTGILVLDLFFALISLPSVIYPLSSRIDVLVIVTSLSALDVVEIKDVLVIVVVGIRRS